MTREEIRRQNARELAKDVGGQTEFGRLVGMEGPQVSQIIGRNPIKNIGNSIAKRIEIAFSKPEGWLDKLHAENAGAGAELISSAVPAQPAEEAHSLSLEKLVLINAIDEKEAALLRRYRMASQIGVDMIEFAVNNAPTRELGIVAGDKTQDRPSGVRDGHSQ